MAEEVTLIPTKEIKANPRTPKYDAWLASTIPRSSNYVIENSFDTRQQKFQGKVLDIYNRQAKSATPLRDHADLLGLTDKCFVGLNAEQYQQYQEFEFADSRERGGTLEGVLTTTLLTQPIKQPLTAPVNKDADLVPANYPQSLRFGCLVCGVLLFNVPYFKFPWMRDIHLQQSIFFTFGLTLVYFATAGKPYKATGEPSGRFLSKQTPFRWFYRVLIFLLSMLLITLSLVKIDWFVLETDSINFYGFAAALIGLALAGTFDFEVPLPTSIEVAAPNGEKKPTITQ